MRSGDDRGRESVTDVSRRLLEQAYPEMTPEWIQQQAELTLQRFNEAKPQQEVEESPAERPGPLPSEAGKPRIHLRPSAVLLLVAVVVVAVVAIVLPRRFADIFVEPGGMVGLAVAAVVAIAVTVVTFVRTRRTPLLSCRVRIDTPWTSDIGGLVRLQRPDETPIADPSVVVAHIKNLGGTRIEQNDYLAPITLSFPGREVVTVDVTESDPWDLQDKVPYDPGFRVDPDRIVLPKVPLRPNDSFKVMVVLSGTNAAHQYRTVTGGRLRNGLITNEQDPRRVRNTTILWGAAAALLAGAFVVVLLLNSTRPFITRPANFACVPGTLSVEGSSALGPAVTKSAGAYTALCSGAFINVDTFGTSIGLEDLKNTSPTGREQLLALSDGAADPQNRFPGLQPDALAVVPYTLVVNNSVDVDSLTIDQVRDIFTGKVTNWREITGKATDDQPIRVIGSTDTSGTRRTLEREVIGTESAPVGQAPPTSDSCLTPRPGVPGGTAIVCEQSTTDELVNKVSSVASSIGYADQSSVTSGMKRVRIDGRDGSLNDIQAGYPFWTVEYAYSNGELPPDSLAAAFKNYLSSSDVSRMLEELHYYPCQSDGPAVAQLCQRGR